MHLISDNKLNPGRDFVRQDGFSFIELVTVIVLVGIVSVAALPRFFDRNTFDTRGFYDQTLSTLRYAQKTAIAQRRLVCVTFPTAGSVQLRIASAFGAAACDTDLQGLNGTTPYTITAPAGVVISGAAGFNFEPVGRTSTAVTAMTIGSYSITIDQETGHVR